jgi:hypothetical protein
MQTWTVKFTGKTRKQKDKLPADISTALDLLFGELETDGPERGNWPHYGRLVNKKGFHHCHLNTGNPPLYGGLESHEPGHTTDRGALCWHARECGLPEN